MYFSDLHTHTIASGHGTRSTISDMARAASLKGLKLLGISDHGPATMCAGTPSYFRSLALAPGKRFGIDILYGAECSVLNTSGQLDLDDETLSLLDYCIASLHTRPFPARSKAENTAAMASAFSHPAVRIAGHLDDGAYELDYETLARSAKRHHVIWEVNEASLAPGGYRGDTRSRCREMLLAAAACDIPILLSSDSHGSSHIGDFTYAAAFVHEVMFPENRILNNQLSLLKELLSEKKG